MGSDTPLMILVEEADPAAAGVSATPASDRAGRRHWVDGLLAGATIVPARRSVLRSGFPLSTPVTRRDGSDAA